MQETWTVDQKIAKRLARPSESNGKLQQCSHSAQYTHLNKIDAEYFSQCTYCIFPTFVFYMHMVPLYYREFLAKYAKFRQQIWAVRQGINPRDKNQKQANFCSQVEGQLRTPYSVKALCM